ncbi:hypothetical protein B0I37DRAFT_419306 [Chaetomium sp. MPI-CAGE-AT-0009]|nr:hypothetical protein B0I37DRAFT_419306 [Chaetomium sp. MPI-CAGE-AT-0009]
MGTTRKEKSKLNWDQYRPIITKLYLEERKTLRQVRKIMEDTYGFKADGKAYKRRFDKWGLEKNLKTKHSIAMLGIARRRKVQENKDTAFKHGREDVLPKDMRRFYGRCKKKCPDFSPDMRAATPPNITYGTPEPETSKYYSLPPAILGYPGQETSEVEQASVGDSAASYFIDGDGSPQAGTVPWEASPEQFSGLGASGPYPGAEQPSETNNMPAEFTQDTFSGHQQPYALDGFSQANLSSAFTPQQWIGPTEAPSHPYHAPAYGTQAWASHPQRLQPTMHSLNLDSTALAFPNHCSTGVGYGVIENTRFDNAIPSQRAIGIPETGSNNLEYMQLHSAVASNDINSAESLLRNRVNPNDAARGGVTPLHCAAFQKNVGMIKLLLRYEASLEATTDKDQSVLFFAVCGQRQLGNSDMSLHCTSTLRGSGPYTDDSTCRTIDALFECPTSWVRLLNGVNKPDKDGVTPLMVAAGQGFQETTTKLLQRGAQPGLRDHANRTALKYAAMNNHRDIVHLLLQVDPAVSGKRDISYILGLASKNIAAGHLHGGQRSLRARRHGSGQMLICEEIVRLCRDTDHGMLDRLLALARQKRKSSVLECLQRAMRQRAMRQLASEGSHAAGA